jgi:hypothetical protein
MYETKPWYTSVGVWGGILAAISPLVQMFGYELNVGALSEVLAAVGALVGGGMAIVGRVRATQVIARRKP